MSVEAEDSNVEQMAAAAAPKKKAAPKKAAAAKPAKAAKPTAEKKAKPAKAAEPEPEKQAPAGNNLKAVVRGYVSRVELLENERRTLAEDIKEIYEEADGAGLNKKALKLLVSDRRRNSKPPTPAQLELETMLDLYEAAMLD